MAEQVTADGGNGQDRPAPGLSDLVGVLETYAAEVDRDARFPVEGLQALRDSGYLGYLVPVEHGGMGGGLDGLVDTAQQLAGGCLSTAMIWAMHCQQVDALVRHAGPALRARLLPRVAAGEVYLASVTTGSGTGGFLLSAADPLSRVPADGPEGAPGRLLLDRHAPTVTGGEHADGYLVTMRADDEAAGHVVSLVYADRHDLVVKRVSDWNAMGMRGTDSAGFALLGSVPDDQLVGGPGEFRTVAVDSTIPVGHLAWSACWLGAARRAFSGLLRTIPRSGRHDTSSPLLQEQLGRIRLDLELVSAYLHRVREEVDACRAAGARTDVPAVQIHLNSLKTAASELTCAAVDRMVQVAGLSLGYRSDAALPLERTFRDLRSAALNYANDRLLTANGTFTLLDRSVTLL
ncbi:acyl-CoA dehydrogenase family protein [Streptomyces sp. GbtcB6]|uniref:acyl-CoA dehydrogenase family protein n=1 Tax=Streptomyces sp. GbtcB6 TaxID=2824751 RepID=UPI001C2F6F1E|nr:acyl-CoA dehydrogenase family protein [Streptomyces sp. GbtcB6]